MTDKKRQYVFGPVPSRRLGRSLGVDLVPLKVCCFDCIYCQVGRTTRHTARRDVYVPTDAVLAELADRLAAGCGADVVTLSGSGEPTLHADLGRIVREIKAMTDLPVAVLTNGALLSDPGVRADVAPADLVLPSLDAADEETFRLVNRPCAGLTFASLVEGLKALRREYAGTIRLEAFFLAGVNDGDDHVGRLKALIDEIGPDRIDVNTVARPPADAEARPAPPQRLKAICAILGPTAGVIAPLPAPRVRVGAIGREDVLTMLRRRPCTVRDVADGLGCHHGEAVKLLEHLVREGDAGTRRQDDRTYYHAKEISP